MDPNFVSDGLAKHPESERCVGEKKLTVVVGFFVVVKTCEIRWCSS